MLSIRGVTKKFGQFTAVDNVSLSKSTYYTDPDGATGPRGLECDPLKAGRYLCDEIGDRLTSSIGY